MKMRNQKVHLLLLDEAKGFCFEALEEIGNEQHFEVTFVDVEEISKRGLYQCMVQLSTVPVAVCFGDDEDATQAKQAAARDALDYLKLMTRK